MSLPGAPDPVYVRARRVLLDALAALQEQRRAVLLVGAQAIYLHTGEGDLAVAPYTADADLALNPAALTDEPTLEVLLRGAGFIPAPEPGRIGTWLGGHNVPVDFLVPAALGGPGSRAARLGAHGDRVARKGRGLEAALVDNVAMTIGALDADDTRRFELVVAGPSALLVAKLHKIAERQGSPSRLVDKDALDVYRLLRTVPTEILVTGIRRLLDDPRSGEVTREALNYLEALFGTAETAGSQMAARALEPLEDAAITAAACAALTDDLLASFRR